MPAAPARLTAANAPLWDGDSYRDTGYTYCLDQAEVWEVMDAVAAAQRCVRGRDVVFKPSISARDFPLTRLSRVLAELAAHVSEGRGFALLRGLPIDGLDEAGCAVLMRGLASYLGTPATQSRDGHLIRHVRATGATLGDTRVRGHQTSERLWFHTDGADAVILLCLRAAEAGGQSRLASAAAVHNKMLDEDASLVRQLYRPHHFHMAGGNAAGTPPTFIAPIFTLHAGRFSVRYIRHTLLETPKVTGVPLDASSLAAFDALERAADALSLDMTLRPGDAQIVNNHTVLHSRTAYSDPDDAQQARHLLRCWVMFPQRQRAWMSQLDHDLSHGWMPDDVARRLARTWAPPAPPSHPVRA